MMDEGVDADMTTSSEVNQVVSGFQREAKSSTLKR